VTLLVRRATRDDAEAIAHIRVETWRAAYAGLIAQDVLDGLDPKREAELRALHWEKHHADPRAVELIAEVEGEPAGWAAAGPAREVERAGEVFAIYALPTYWSSGVGHALMIECERFLRGAGFRRAYLWYLEGNERAASFYERHGWLEDGATKSDDRLVGPHAVLHERRRVRNLAEARST
jgi:GNAT superfamily N-acetyltransferase